MNSYKISDLNDLRKALRKIEALAATNAFEDYKKQNFINIILPIQEINPTKRFYFYTLNDNVVATSNFIEEDYNGILYTIKILLIKIYKLINRNLTLTLIYEHPPKNPNPNQNQLVIQNNIKFFNMIKELQLELQMNPNKLFFQINKYYESQLLQDPIKILQNPSLSKIRMYGALFFQETSISNMITTMEKGYLEQLMTTPALKKISYLEIHLTNLNNYEVLFNCFSDQKKISMIFEKEKNQLFKFFLLIKDLINKHPNLVKLNIHFGQYNLHYQANLPILRLFNILPKEYKHIQHIYNNLVQDNLLINVRKKLEKNLTEMCSISKSINNLQSISQQEDIMTDDFLKNKLKKELTELKQLWQCIYEEFYVYINMLHQKEDSSVFYYLAKIYEFKQEFKTAYAYLELVKPTAQLFNKANEAKILLCLNQDFIPGFKDFEFAKTDNPENKVLLFSQLGNQNLVVTPNHAEEKLPDPQHCSNSSSSHTSTSKGKNVDHIHENNSLEDNSTASSSISKTNPVPSEIDNRDELDHQFHRCKNLC